MGNFFSWLFKYREDEEASSTDRHIVEWLKLLARHDSCEKAGDEWERIYQSPTWCVDCPMTYGFKSRPDYWDCTKEGESARRWLREHGIKEEA